MVRLKEYEGIRMGLMDEKFQFQYGAIKGTSDERYFCPSTDFNSSMVRLKVAGILNGELELWLFQFQYGAIKGQPSFTAQNSAIDFNSSMVRLKDSSSSCHRPQEHISIPVWCD